MLTPRQQALHDILPKMLYCTQNTVGAYMDEKCYQSVMIRNLEVCGFADDIVYEGVFDYWFKDMNNKRFKVGNGINARTDIEIQGLRVLFELKSSTSATTDKQVAQCRNYMNHREDIDIGYVVNFISKGDNQGSYTQLDTLIKTNERSIIEPKYDFGSVYDNSVIKYIRIPTEYSVTQECLNDSIIIKERNEIITYF